MADFKYSSVDAYRVLDTVRKKVIGLACQGKHDDQGESYSDLLDYIQNECQAAAIRAARSAAEARRRQRPPRELTSD